MKLIEVTETQDPLAESANYKEPKTILAKSRF
jgi:hypothetical protein